MSESSLMGIRVPEGMQSAGFEALCESERTGETPAYGAFLRACLRWAIQHPAEFANMKSIQLAFSEYRIEGHTDEWLVEELFRRAFAAPEPEMPEEVKDIAKRLFPDIVGGDHLCEVISALNEAFNRGRRIGEQP